MTSSGSFQIRHITFLGPKKPPAQLSFKPGFNLLYGASDTGKSFVLESINFMLGKSPPLPDIKERQGYDSILLGIENSEGKNFTLLRSAEGGDFKLFAGAHLTKDTLKEGVQLAQKHSAKNDDNLSSFLLDILGLKNKLIRTNAQGKTRSLSFRDLSKIASIVSEDDIKKRRSPLDTGNPTERTPLYAAFRLLLTGVDDSGIIKKEDTKTKVARESKTEVLEQLIEEFQHSLQSLSTEPDSLEDQLRRVSATIEETKIRLTDKENVFRDLSKRKIDLRSKYQQFLERHEEISGLLERFNLLNRHYESDLQRLSGMEEAGAMLSFIEMTQCPLCGAEQEHQNIEGTCDGNIEDVINSAKAEAGKILLLKKELADTILDLKNESKKINRTLPSIKEDLESVSKQLEEKLSGEIGGLRENYSDLVQTESRLKLGLDLRKRIEGLFSRMEKAKAPAKITDDGLLQKTEISTGALDEFAHVIEELLKRWSFPNAKRVFFDKETSDIQINGKNRISYGQGLRAVTHSAFTLGLLEYCRRYDKPHPGFVLLDSPMLAYRKPEDSSDDLSATDVKKHFFDYLSDLEENQQVIIFENVDPPEYLKDRDGVVFFSGNAEIGRQGFFPIKNSPH